MNPMNKIRNIVARGMVALVSPGSMMQTLQMRLTAGEVKDGMEHFEPYGFTSNPKAGAEGVALFFGGDRSHGVVVCVGDRRFRLKGLEPGEVALYTDQGDSLVFKRGRIVELNTETYRVNATKAVEFNTPQITTTGRIESVGDQVAGGVSTMQHVHEDSDKKPVPGG